ncbi:hypothetical protein ACNKHU_03755 [Shigella flexneri]
MAEGSACLRAKFDMASPFMVMRDPALTASDLPPPPDWQRVVHLPDVRLHHCICDALEGSPTPRVPWSSRTTIACSTGCWTT